MLTGNVFQIQRFSVHDGPGIRTTLFLKGCNNHCSWCHNPESLSSKPEIELFPERCIGCGECVKVCPTGARYSTEQGLEYNRKLCKTCGLCTDICWSNAMELVGKQYTLQDTLKEALKDRIYYNESGGGVTLSGGEPFVQPQFTLELLENLKKEGIHTTVQTAGAISYDLLTRFLPWIDLIMFDLKAFSTNIYTSHISSSRDLVYETLEKLLTESDKDVVVRTPLIGGVNDTFEEIEGMTHWLGQFGERVKYYQLIPYHSLGLDKYHRLGLPGSDFTTPTPEVINTLEKVASQYVTVRSHHEQNK